MRYVASVSFGKDSLAMLLYILEIGLPLDEVVFYNTGMEFEAIYVIRDRIILVLAERGIKFTELHPKRPFIYDMLERPVFSVQKGEHLGYGWCGGLCRWGTTEKIAAIDQYTKGCHVYVGIAADEIHRCERLPEWKSSPIAEAGMTEADCLEYCYERGYSWIEDGVELYDILDRVSCWCCSNKNRKELKNIYRYLPRYWEKLKDIQSKLDRPMKNFFSLRYGEYGNIFDMEVVFKDELYCEERDISPMKKNQFLYDYQFDAMSKMKNGCILCGGVGSGKSRTSLAYYFTQHGGMLHPHSPMDSPRDLYIITTARKRDTKEWEGELIPFLLTTNPETNYYKNKVVIDSWNNIKKYSNVTDGFFIFDEQRVVGSGAWVKAFLKIARSNKWILLSATPGDTWVDYIPVFVANGFYRNKTEFINEHVIYSRYTKYPKIDRFVNTGRLISLRNDILVDMDFKRQTISHHEDVYVRYDITKYKDVFKNRWDVFKNEPIQQASGLCYVLRRIVNTDESRQLALLELFEKHPRMIVFYNFDYELNILKSLYYGENVEIAEWNGHKHQPVPDSKQWVYLVQYTAGAEGWNCIKTDTIVFYSQNYSYKIMQQSAGRIDRLNTPYTDLYYYHLKTRSGIDLAISKALRDKKSFNESRWVKW